MLAAITQIMRRRAPWRRDPSIGDFDFSADLNRSRDTPSKIAATQYLPWRGTDGAFVWRVDPGGGGICLALPYYLGVRPAN